MKKIAILILQDGTTFYGTSTGIDGYVVGEIVFNTAMTGYQEILTDPSYSKQIIAFTYPHIGNVGTNKKDEESKKIHAKGIITKNISKIASNFRNTKNLLDYIKEKKIISISNIDTRKLTRIIRKKGTQYGCIQTQKYLNIQLALKKINLYSIKEKKNLTLKVCTNKIIQWNIEKKIQNKKKEKKHLNKLKKKYQSINIIVYDFGVKKNILKILKKYGCNIILVPSNTKIKKIISLNPSGILLSNGPGDPRLCIESIKTVKKLIKHKIPIFGICLGHQILALATGAKIIKMKFGHHGSNHPVQNIITKKVFITSQNHNFTIDPATIDNNKISITHISLFDKSIQGISLKNNIAFSFQGHPEANPGTKDIQILFYNFIKKIYHREENA